jgi:hypothetical protein
MELLSVITCPACGYKVLEPMPTDALSKRLRLQTVPTPYEAHQGEVPRVLLRVLLIRVGSVPAGAGWGLLQLTRLRS